MFFLKHKCKKNYCCIKSKLKIAPAFSVLHDKNYLPIESDFDKTSFCLIKPFKKYWLKMMKTKVLNLLIKTA